jgi:hypothetical protein
LKKLESTFCSCTSLETITLQAGIKEFDEYTFEDCDALKTIFVPARKADYYKNRLPNDLCELIVELPAEKKAKPAEKKTNKVNIINFWGSHVFDEIIERFGYEPQYIIPFSTVEQLSHISEAAASIHICPSLSTYMGAGLNQLHGVPEVLVPPAYGVAGTDRWLRAF